MYSYVVDIYCLFSVRVYLFLVLCFFFFKQKTAYEIVSRDWSSDVCSSDLVFSATDNLKNLKLHHINYDHNMSLWDDFRQNRRPKVFREKIAIFPRRVPGNTCKTLKTWLWVFSAIDNLKNLKLHHIDNDPNKIGRAHVWTPVTWNDLVCRPLLEKKK